MMGMDGNILPIALGAFTVLYIAGWFWFRDGGIDAVGSLPEYWRVIERATDEQ